MNSTITIPCISLWQPWAMLCVLCDPALLALHAEARLAAKNFETRSWAPWGKWQNYRGPLLIHAAQRFTRVERETCQTEPFRTVLRDWGGFERAADLPLGCIVGRVLLDAIHSTDQIRPILERSSPARELAFGDYSPGRKAWKLERPERFERPIPYRGLQGIFEVPATALQGAGVDVAA